MTLKIINHKKEVTCELPAIQVLPGLFITKNINKGKKYTLSHHSGCALSSRIIGTKKRLFDLAYEYLRQYNWLKSMDELRKDEETIVKDLVTIIKACATTR